MRRVERADANESKLLDPAIFAAHGYSAALTAKDAMQLAAVRGDAYGHKRGARKIELVSLDQQIQNEGAAGFALTAQTMATVYEEGRFVDAKARGSTRATAFKLRHAELPLREQKRNLLAEASCVKCRSVGVYADAPIRKRKTPELSPRGHKFRPD
jgi:hypothetical protein